MRIAIIGSRTIDHDDENMERLVKNYVHQLVGWEEVKSLSTGCARGIDTIALNIWRKAYSKKFKFAFHYLPADWKKYGDQAGTINNELIEQSADICFAFVNTKINDLESVFECVSLFDKKGKKVYIINIEKKKVETRN